MFSHAASATIQMLLMSPPVWNIMKQIFVPLPALWHERLLTVMRVYWVLETITMHTIWSLCSSVQLGKKSIIDQVATMLATSKTVLFPGPNHQCWWSDTLVITQTPADLEIGHFLEVGNMVVTWWIVAFYTVCIVTVVLFICVLMLALCIQKFVCDPFFWSHVAACCKVVMVLDAMLKGLRLISHYWPCVMQECRAKIIISCYLCPPTNNRHQVKWKQFSCYDWLQLHTIC